MIRVFIQHGCADFDKWIAEYRRFADVQRRLGVRREGVARSIDDANQLTIWHDFDDRETAEAFLASAELADGMTRAGNTGDVQVWFSERA